MSIVAPTICPNHLRASLHQHLGLQEGELQVHNGLGPRAATSSIRDPYRGHEAIWTFSGHCNNWEATINVEELQELSEVLNIKCKEIKLEGLIVWLWIENKIEYPRRLMKHLLWKQGLMKQKHTDSGQPSKTKKFKRAATSMGKLTTMLATTPRITDPKGRNNTI